MSRVSGELPIAMQCEVCPEILVALGSAQRLVINSGGGWQ